MALESIVILLIVGAVAGWLAGLIVKGIGFGLIGNIVVGVDYRQGWGRVYNDDGLFHRASRRSIARSRCPEHRLVVDDPALEMHTRRRTQGGTHAGVTREASDFNPLKVLPAPQMTATREAIVLPLMFLRSTLLGGVRVGHRVHSFRRPSSRWCSASCCCRRMVRGGVLRTRATAERGQERDGESLGLILLLALLAASRTGVHAS